MIRILLADDHTIFRQGLREILEAEPGFSVVKEAATGREAMDHAFSDPCDVMLLDISMPDIHGLDVLKQIRHGDSNMAVIILSMHPEEHYGLRTLKAGAAGYLTKDCEAAELIAAIQKVHNGGVHLSSRLAEMIANSVGGRKGVTPNEILSDREYQILAMIAAGARIKSIAEKLGLSPKTVSTYRTRLLHKLSLETNEQLCSYARHHGLLD